MIMRTDGRLGIAPRRWRQKMRRLRVRVYFQTGDPPQTYYLDRFFDSVRAGRYTHSVATHPDVRKLLNFLNIPVEDVAALEVSKC